MIHAIVTISQDTINSDKKLLKCGHKDLPYQNKTKNNKGKDGEVGNYLFSCNNVMDVVNNTSYDDY